MAPGVYAYYPKDAREPNDQGGAAATSSDLIVGSRSALLIDTLLNERLYRQVLELAGMSTKPPLDFAVNTSAHCDHSYGNMYLPSSTKIIQHAKTRSYVDARLGDDKAFLIKNFGAVRGIEDIEARTGDIMVPSGGRLTIDLGGKTVEIIDFGFAQTGGDLFIWQPDAKVLWAGNAIIAGKPALPWLLDGHPLETLATLRRVYDFLPADARIVPGHGVPISREDIRRPIDYLSAVKTQVEAAIREGLTLEETVAKVKMNDYRGYVCSTGSTPR